MTRQLLIVLLIIIFVLPVHAQACGDFESRLQPGMIVRVTAGEPNNVRAEPSLSSELVGQLDGGTTFVVLGEAVCADGLTWWEVRNSRTGVEGYTVEGTSDSYWTEPASIDILAENMAVNFTPVANDMTLEMMPPMSGDNGFRGPSPSFIQADLVSPIVGGFHDSEIVILPIGDFEDIHPEMYERLTWMRERVLNPSTDDPIPTPLIYAFGAARIHESHVEWLSNDVMIGTRYLAQYAQYSAPIRGFELFYTYQGVTYDGRYWVSMILPVIAPPLDSYYDTIRDDIWNDVGVTQEGHNLLDTFATNMADSEFFPTLDVLDNVVLSLNFDGAEGLPAPIVTRLPETYSFDLSALGDSASIEEERHDNVGYLTLYILEAENDAPGWLNVHDERSMASRFKFEHIPILQDLLETQPVNIESIENIHDGWEVYVLGEPTYVETDTLSGVGYFGKGIGSPLTSWLTYHFQGLTHDGAYYLSGGYVVEVPNLSEHRDAFTDEEWERATSRDEATYLAYFQEAQAEFADLTSDDFSPSVDTILGIFASFQLD